MNAHEFAGARVALDAVGMPLTLIAAVGVMFANLAPGLLYTPAPEETTYEHALIEISYARLRMALGALATVVGLVAAVVQVLARNWVALGLSLIVIILGCQLLVTLALAVRRLQRASSIT